MRYFLLLAAAAVLFTGCARAPRQGADSPPVAKMGVSEMTPAEARSGVEAAYSQFIDVRTPEEFAAGHAYRARNIPLEVLADNLDKLEQNEPVYLICRTGNRSGIAADMLVKKGFKQAVNITGGMEAWAAAGLPMEK